MKNIYIIDGPNLNLVGAGREPSIYGSHNIPEYLQQFDDENIHICYYQSNHEGAIIDHIQWSNTDKNALGIILNAGAYTHTSIAIADCIRAIDIPVIEVHLSNIYNREEYRSKSYISPVCKGTISGFGLKSYKLAIKYLSNE